MNRAPAAVDENRSGVAAGRPSEAIRASVGLGWSYANPVRFHGHDRARAQLLAVLGQYVSGDRSLLGSSEADEANDASVRQSMNDRKFSKVLVDGDDHLRRLEGATENLVVAWIPRPIGDRFNLMTGMCEDTSRSSPDASVEEHLHGYYRSLKAGSTRSWPTSRRA